MYTRLIIMSLSTILGFSLLSPVLAAEYSSHISAPVWSSQEPLSISYGVVKVGLELMSEKRVGLCLEEGMDPVYSTDRIYLPENNLRKEFIPNGKPCKPLHERDNFIRTEVNLDTGYYANQYLDLSERIDNIVPSRISLSWDIQASGVDGTFLRGTKFFNDDSAIRAGKYQSNRPSKGNNPGGKLYRSQVVWTYNPEVSQISGGILDGGEDRVWFHKARKGETTGTILVDIPRSQYLKNYGVVLAIDPNIKIESLKYVFKDGATEATEAVDPSTFGKSFFGGIVIRKADLWRDVVAVEVKYSY